MRLLKSQSGMTLPEVMIASMLGVMLLSLVFSTMYMTDVAKKEVGAYLDMTNKMRVVMDRMAYGYRQAGQANRRGIAEAVSCGSLPQQGSTQLDYVDINAVTHSIRTNNGNIEYRRGSGGAWVTLLDPNGSPSFDASQYSTYLNFSQSVTNSVVVKLSLGRLIKGRWYYASASTEIAFRNYA